MVCSYFIILVQLPDLYAHNVYEANLKQRISSMFNVFFKPDFNCLCVIIDVAEN